MKQPIEQGVVTLIENGNVYGPAPLGRCDVLLINERIVKVGKVDRRAVEALDLDLEVIDATGGVITPGLIDPHEHLLGGSGERGFSTQTPEIHLSEIVSAGITTVVGTLGVDTTMKTIAGLLAKVKALKEEGMSAFLWTGGYNVPPSTITDSVRDDIMYIAEVIGAGEIAISDERSTDPVAHELARLVSNAYVGGILSRKAGVTHFHVGERQGRLKLLRSLIDEYDTVSTALYPTHIERDEELMREAIALTHRGSFVDIDTVNEDLPRWLKFYLDNGGDASKLTISSDASVTSPINLYEQFRACIVEHGFQMEQVLRLATENPAEVLKLNSKGKIEPSRDADLLVLREGSLEIKDVILRGRRVIKNGRAVIAEKFLEDSNRQITLRGK
jgi:beta-aspartyl-dipeptidase (metallo-type)